MVRLSLYHCELNPLEFAWASVKNYFCMNNTTYKLQYVRKTIVKRRRTDYTRYVEKLCCPCDKRGRQILTNRCYI